MSNRTNIPFYRQLWHFLIHLRWHYQLFILSGGYLMGGFFQLSIDWTTFVLQFLNVHLLLFGGATAYNSWWDKDEGAIGGLRHPPKMNRWMWFASMVIQYVGLLFAIGVSLQYAIIYGVSMLFFWLYSTPLARWKGKPVRSLVAIGISTGTNSFLLGYLAAGAEPIGVWALIASVGVALVILSLYPTSQIYQIEEDQNRGDRTFAIFFGEDAVFSFFRYAFGTGITLLSGALAMQNLWVGCAFLVVGFVTGVVINRTLGNLTSHPDDYDHVMQIKYGTSLAFVLFLCAGIVIKHYFGWFIY